MSTPVGNGRSTRCFHEEKGIGFMNAKRSYRDAVTVLLAMTVAVAVMASAAPASGQIEYVIHISVDGLRPDAVTVQGAAALPNLYRMRTQGAFTDNARTDVNFTVTLPNHVDQMTGRGVYGPSGFSHNWSANSWGGQTLASNKGSYVAGVYDVAHDNGMRTGHYASKSKFGLFDVSWNATNGAPDVTGPDNGRDKIDVYLNTSNTANLTNSWVADMAAAPQQYSFVHYTDPDTVGHGSGWMSTNYLNSVKKVDGHLGQMFDLIDTNPTFAGKTAIVLTSDHGGHGRGHGSIIPDDYTIPFYVWGPGVTAGGDLYAMNGGTRLDPGVDCPSWSATIQPVRNGDAPNLALDLLGLGAIPGSGTNFGQDLAVPEPASVALLGLGALALIRRRRRTA